MNALNLWPGFFVPKLIKISRTGIGNRKFLFIFSDLSTDVLSEGLKDIRAGGSPCRRLQGLPPPTPDESNTE
jgi:hypothetical protein